MVGQLLIKMSSFHPVTSTTKWSVFEQIENDHRTIPTQSTVSFKFALPILGVNYSSFEQLKAFSLVMLLNP